MTYTAYQKNEWKKVNKMEKSEQSMSGLPMVVENLKAIKVLVADALQEYCYIKNAADCAKYNFKRISASFEAIRALNTEAIDLLKSDGIDIE
jgi:hypothetical protein